jgi:uncharacterized protein
MQSDHCLDPAANLLCVEAGSMLEWQTEAWPVAGLPYWQSDMRKKGKGAMILERKRRYIGTFVTLSLLIVFGQVITAVLFPHLYGFSNLGEFFQRWQEGFEQSGVPARGTALLPQLAANWQYPPSFLIQFYTISPTLVGIALSYFYFKGEGLKIFFSRYLPWRNGIQMNEGLKIWLILVTSLVAIKLASAGLKIAFGIEARDIGSPDIPFAWGVDILSLTFAWWFFSAMFLDQGGLLEEGGWRGFMAPILQCLTSSPLRAAVIIGIVHVIWHIPREIATFSSVQSVIYYYVFYFAPMTIAFAIIIQYFFNKLGGSVLAAIAIHGLSNDSIYLGGPFAKDNTLVLVLHLAPYVVAAGIIIKIAGKRLALRDEDRIPVVEREAASAT